MGITETVPRSKDHRGQPISVQIGTIVSRLTETNHFVALESSELSFDWIGKVP